MAQAGFFGPFFCYLIFVIGTNSKTPRGWRFGNLDLDLLCVFVRCKLGHSTANTGTMNGLLMVEDMKLKQAGGSSSYSKKTHT